MRGREANAKRSQTYQVTSQFVPAPLQCPPGLSDEAHGRHSSSQSSATVVVTTTECPVASGVRAMAVNSRAAYQTETSYSGCNEFTSFCVIAVKIFQRNHPSLKM